MATTPNDPSPGDGSPPRRLRFDADGATRSDQGHSGRWLVAVAVVTVLVVWGGLYLAFRGWRARVLARAAYGAREVAPTVDPIARLVPPDVSEDEWREAVRQTHDLIVALAGANLLDQAHLEQLRAELAARVAAARPETARDVLRSIWDDLCARAGPVLARRARPKVLE